MNLFRNIIMAFMAFVVLGMAAPAFAKSNLETVACRDAGFAALPFSGTAMEKETYATALPIGTEVLVDGVPVKLASGDSLWSKCKTGPSAIEIANARVSALETENARLTTMAYHTVTDGSGRQVRVTWASTARATASALEASKATVAKDALTLKADRNADIIQNIFIYLFLVAFLIAAFRNNLDRIGGEWLNSYYRWQSKRAAAKARKNAKPAPMAPAGDPTGIDRVESDERPSWGAGQP